MASGWFEIARGALGIFLGMVSGWNRNGIGVTSGWFRDGLGMVKKMGNDVQF